jgi:hypothetical protein
VMNTFGIPLALASSSHSFICVICASYFGRSASQFEGER